MWLASPEKYCNISNLGPAPEKTCPRLVSSTPDRSASCLPACPWVNSTCGVYWVDLETVLGNLLGSGSFPVLTPKILLSTSHCHRFSIVSVSMYTNQPQSNVIHILTKECAETHQRNTL